MPNAIALPDADPPANAVAVVERVAMGETVKQNVGGEGQPTWNNFFYCLAKYPKLSTIYREARKVSAHALFAEALEMAREIADAPGSPQHVNATRVLIQHLQWAAAKLAPQDYGERIQAPGGVTVIIETSLSMDKPGAGQMESGTYTIEAKSEPLVPEGDEKTLRTGEKE